MKKSIIYFFLITSCLLTVNSVFAQNETKIAKDVSVKEFKSLIEKKPGTILDVRTQGEVSKGAIKGSVNHDLFDDNFEAKLEELDKTKPVYVYCASGGRSSEAMGIMKKKGFNEVYNLSGGYGAWMKDQKK